MRFPHTVRPQVRLDLTALWAQSTSALREELSQTCTICLTLSFRVAAALAASAAEEAANNQRWQESGGGVGSADQWYGYHLHMLEHGTGQKMMTCCHKFTDRHSTIHADTDFVFTVPWWLNLLHICPLMSWACCRRWSLNWNDITPEIVVGSCPRSTSDIDRMVDEANISAIICLQASQLCTPHYNSSS